MLLMFSSPFFVDGVVVVVVCVVVVGVTGVVIVRVRREVLLGWHVTDIFIAIY